MKSKEAETPENAFHKMTKDELISIIADRKAASCLCPIYPNGLVGQKVKYRKHVAKKKYHPSELHPLPQRGYFTIMGAHLTDWSSNGLFGWRV